MQSISEGSFDVYFNLKIIKDSVNCIIRKLLYILDKLVSDTSIHSYEKKKFFEAFKNLNGSDKNRKIAK